MSSGGGGAGPLIPTFHGFVHNSMDGLVLFEACLSGKLHHVPRRPHDRERSNLIKSGSIFIYEENASGIKRWTDGVAWSPSRILGNFLIYRELEKPFPPGEKKRAMKRKRTSEAGEPYPRRNSHIDSEPLNPPPLTPPSPNAPASESKPELNGNDQDKELERALIGSLVDSYGFRPDGLVKKTMSISINGVSHHMVSYYKVDDVKNNVLPRPLSDPRLQNISVRPELYLKQNFRAPVEETEHYAIDSHMHAHPQVMYSGVPYGVRPGQYMGGYSNVYGVSPAASPYGAVSGASWPSQPVSAGHMSYGGHSGYSGSPYGGYYKPQSSGEGKPSDQQHASQDMSYANGYSPAYSPSVQRGGPWQTPMPLNTSGREHVVDRWSESHHQQPSHFARQSYGGQSSMTSPTTNGQPQHSYAPSQSYAVRSPTQSYSIQSAPNSAVPQSPHHSVKRTNSADPGSATSTQPMSASDAQMSYRPGSYAVGGTPQSALSNGVGSGGRGSTGGGGAGSPSTDMAGLGISTGGSYGSVAQSQQPHSAGTNYSYPPSAGLPTYRSVAGELASAAQAQTAHHYSQ